MRFTKFLPIETETNRRRISIQHSLWCSGMLSPLLAEWLWMLQRAMFTKHSRIILRILFSRFISSVQWNKLFALFQINMSSTMKIIFSMDFTFPGSADLEFAQPIYMGSDSNGGTYGRCIYSPLYRNSSLWRISSAPLPDRLNYARLVLKWHPEYELHYTPASTILFDLNSAI